MLPGNVEIEGLPVGNSVHSRRKRSAIQCGSCEQPIAMSNRPLRVGAGFICSACIDDLGRLVDTFDLPEGTEPNSDEGTEDAADFGTFDDEHDDERARRLGAEQAYAEALDDEIEHDVDADGPPGRTRPERDRWRP